MEEIRITIKLLIWGDILKQNTKTAQSEIGTKREGSLRKFLNVLGVFIFGGFALSIFTNPIPSYEIKEFVLFCFGSMIIFYFLVNIYFMGHIGRKIFFATLFLLGSFSLFMACYLLTNAIPH